MLDSLDTTGTRGLSSLTIVVVNDFAYVDGGASKVALGSARALAARGHRVILFTAVGPVAPELIDVEGLTVQCLGQYEIVADPNRVRAAVRGLWNPESAAAFRRCLDALNPADTIIHLHTWTKALTASVVRVALELNYRVVLTMHDFFSVCPAGSFFLHPTQQICSLRPMSPECVRTDCDSRSYPQKLWRVGRQFLQNHAGGLPSGLRHFITISTLSESMLAPYLPGSARLHRVPNFTDVARDEPAEVDAHTTFTYVGRLSPEKGTALLAACVSRLDLDTIFVGEGPLRAELSAQAPQAKFTGWVSPLEAASVLRRSRALIFPSLWAETQGLVVAEAAAMGVPAIVPSTSAAREWVEDNVTGLIFRGGDVEDLARKIVFLRDHPEAARTMGRESYQRYWRRPATIERHCAELEAVYQEMLSS